jgi:hypothetical protein
MVADQKKTDVAQALEAMAGGAVPSEAETPSGGIPSETTVFGQAIPDVAPEMLGAHFPANLRQPSPQGSLRSTSPPIPPLTRVQPADPDRRQGRIRPAMPERRLETLTPPASVEDNQPADALADIVEDDDTIAAAPDASAFAPRFTQRPAQVRIYANLFFRRTIIPILLTCGLLLTTIGLWSMSDRTAPLAAVGTGVEILLIVVGAILFALGILNAFHMRHILANTAKRPTDQ